MKALHLLGRDNSEEAIRAINEANDHLKVTTGQVILCMDEGRRARVAGKERLAVKAFREALPQALDIRSPALLANALALLAEIYASGSGTPQAALEYSAAAVISWPPTTYLRDYDRVKRVFVELYRPLAQSSTNLIDALVEGKSYPIALASQMPDYRVERARQRLRDALRTPSTTQRR